MTKLFASPILLAIVSALFAAPVWKKYPLTVKNFSSFAASIPQRCLMGIIPFDDACRSIMRMWG